MRIAHGLQVQLTDLVGLPAAPARRLVRAAERATLPTPTKGLEIELLAENVAGGQISAISHLAPGSSVEARGDRPPGQEYFIRGAARVKSRAPDRSAGSERRARQDSNLRPRD
jgi:hypothetical protein